MIVPVNVCSSESIVTSADWPFEMERMSVSSTETSMVIFLSGQIVNELLFSVVVEVVEDELELP